jgi:acetyl esterase/lipase
VAIKNISIITLNFNNLTSRITSLIIATVLAFTIASCAFKRVSRSKNITYLQADTVANRTAQELNVFAPRKHADPKDVFVFIYGGTWNSGKKSLYNFLGNRMARKDVVTVVIDYPKSPQSNYDEMATDAAKAVKWVKDNIANYGGNPDKIFVSGHSAGGHLASLISVRDDYFDKLGIANPIKGTILIDAAGLDMYTFLKQENYPDDNTYIQTFTNNPDNWKAGSPLFHLHKGMPPMLIYVGGRTYPSIKLGNDMLVADLKKLGYDPPYYLLKRKKHKPMITQFLNARNKRYKEIIHFMRNIQ